MAESRWLWSFQPPARHGGRGHSERELVVRMPRGREPRLTIPLKIASNAYGASVRSYHFNSPTDLCFQGL